MAGIYCITDDRDFIELLRLELEDFGIAVSSFSEKERKDRREEDIVVIDSKIFLTTPKNVDFPGPVFVFSQNPSIRQAIDCIKSGAREYFDVENGLNELIPALRDEMSLSTKEEISRHNIDKIVGSSQSALSLRARLSQVCHDRAPILINGEHGTGKSLAAKTVHANARKFDEPFFSIDCSKIQENLIETELFGDVGSNKRGLLTIKDRRSVYLKEVWALNNVTQVKIHKFLEQEPEELRPRLIVGSSVALRPLVEKKDFNKMLFQSLNQNSIEIVSLRERPDDIIEIAHWLLKKSQRRLQKTGLALSKEAEIAIREYEWPGNVSELENVLDRATILTKSNSLIYSHVLAISGYPVEKNEAAKAENEVGASLESYFLSFVLENQDHMTETQLAGKLGISRKSLWERRQRLKIPRTKTRKRGPRVEKDTT